MSKKPKNDEQERPAGSLADLLARLVKVPKEEVQAIERERPKRQRKKAS